MIHTLSQRSERGCVLFIGTQFSNLYTAVDTPPLRFSLVIDSDGQRCGSTGLRNRINLFDTERASRVRAPIQPGETTWTVASSARVRASLHWVPLCSCMCRASSAIVDGDKGSEQDCCIHKQRGRCIRGQRGRCIQGEAWSPCGQVKRSDGRECVFYWYSIQ